MSCGIKPVGTTVVVLPDPVEEKTAGGIIVATNQEYERLQMAQVDGVVVSISPDAFNDLGESSPRCKVGDRVIFAKYSGMIRKGKDDLEYRLINDQDILAVLGEDNE